MTGPLRAQQECGWPDRFRASLRENLRNLQLWLFVVALLTLCRVAHLVALRDFWPLEGVAVAMVATLCRGMRFDCQAATYLAAFPILLASCGLFSARLLAGTRFARQSIAALVVFAAPLLAFCSVGYYLAFEDRLNAFMFELFREETWFTVRTMQSSHGLTQRLIGSLGISLALWFVWRAAARWNLLTERHANWLSATPGRRIVCAASIALLFVLGLRASLGSRPLNGTDVAVTRHQVFNDATLNGFHAIYQATREFQQLLENERSESRLDENELLAALQTVVDERGLTGLAEPRRLSKHRLDDPYHQVAEGNSQAPPEHIFLLIMESYDAWPFLEQYRSLQLVEEGQRLAAAGLHVRNFLPSTNCSLGSYLATASGLFATSYLQQREYPTSLAAVFNRLGYRTRMIVGHSAAWYDSDQVAARQGFAEFHGSAHIRGDAADGLYAQDAELFDYTRQLIQPGVPSLNVIRTISAHGPYLVDLKQEGCEIESLPPELEALCAKERGPLLRHLGHLKYSDKCLGRFIAQVEREFPNSLFVITGDHQGRHFPHGRPTEFERVCVPLILYGKEALRGKSLPPGAAGSHIDITATLAHLAAPRGFRFASLGKNLLDPQRELLGISESHLIGANFILNCQEETPLCAALPGNASADYEVASGDNHDSPLSADRIARLRRVFAAYHTLSNWLGDQDSDDDWERFLATHTRQPRSSSTALANPSPASQILPVAWLKPVDGNSAK